MSFANEKRSILFTGYTAMGNGLTFEQFKEVATNAKEAGLTHVDLGSAMLDRSRWQLDNDGNYEPGYDFYPEYTAAFADPFKFHCPKALEKLSLFPAGISPVRRSKPETPWYLTGFFTAKSQPCPFSVIT